MSVAGCYIGYGIELDLVTVVEVLDLYDEDFEEVENYIRNNKIKGLKLTLLEKSHNLCNKNKVYLGIFIGIGDDFGDTLMHDKQKLELQQLLSHNEFESLCQDLFDQPSSLMTVVCGCRCCT